VDLLKALDHMDLSRTTFYEFAVDFRFSAVDLSYSWLQNKPAPNQNKWSLGRHGQFIFVMTATSTTSSWKKNKSILALAKSA